ncbi:phosphate ABC transporter permease PstA [Marivibrio halodurans]|uniref:Phosphate transport system permease protein PstA n=1 Tax=Marivibrio halodurans TaxID=2039722 RepID=A0A8J7S9M7_9PROT|nr:phosphate ABC transporter permease PstA [Marivibrio halodurans]
MTDTTAAPLNDPKKASERVRQSLARRYAAEKRFRAYGLIAIGLAMCFIAILFFDIISKGHSAFLQSHVTLSVELTKAEVDPKGDGSVDSLRSGNYRGLVRGAFAGLFEGIEGRSERRELLEMLSGSADSQLRDYVLENPDSVGQTVDIQVKLDDDADIYFKGKTVEVETIAVNGTASPTGTTGEVRVLSTANDFGGVLSDVKGLLAERAADLEETIAGNERRIELFRERLANAGTEEARSDIESTIASLEYDIGADRERIEDLRRRIANPGNAEELTDEMPSFFVRINGGVVKATSVDNAEIAGQVILPLANQNDALRGEWEILHLPIAESDRRLTDKQVIYLWDLERRGLVEKQFNTTLFTAGDSREPEQAGIWGAVVGSFYTLVVTLLLSFPIGVMTAVYLEEFAPKNKWTDLIEVNINNLAAVPSIVFGLLGLAMFLNFFGLPRSAPVVGGLVLTLMTLPTIIIAGRAALKAVPPSIREAALGMGASRIQAMTHHVLPLAMPGMLTGTIIGMAQALGETAPLLMIGMVAFIVDIPGGFTDPATVLPVQIYIWADSPERAFVERTSAAIMVLLAFLITMNLTAVLLRKRFEKRW